jgi:hypothetical protein
MKKTEGRKSRETVPLSDLFLGCNVKTITQKKRLKNTTRLFDLCHVVKQLQYMLVTSIFTIRMVHFLKLKKKQIFVLYILHCTFTVHFVQYLKFKQTLLIV